jgi:hypothetical protein
LISRQQEKALPVTFFELFCRGLSLQNLRTDYLAEPHAGDKPIGKYRG